MPQAVAEEGLVGVGGVIVRLQGMLAAVRFGIGVP